MKLTPEVIESLTCLTRDFLVPAFRAELKKEAKEILRFRSEVETQVEITKRKLEELREDISKLKTSVGKQIIETLEKGGPS